MINVHRNANNGHPLSDNSSHKISAKAR